MKTGIFVHMNSNCKIIFVFSFFIISSTRIFSQDCQAKLIIKTDEDSSIIKLNNTLLGYGNIETELNQGKYILHVDEPGDEWDAKHFKDTINVSGCNEIKLSYNFNSSIYLKTVPQDAYVYSGDSLIGHTPLFVPKRFNSISLSKPGYKDKFLSLNHLLKNNEIQLKYIGENNGKNFYEKDIFKILIGSIVALGGTTAYFKLKADNRFDSYQETGEQAYLDQTRKFDLISGITMTALQINFGILIYYFLTD